MAGPWENYQSAAPWEKYAQVQPSPPSPDLSPETTSPPPEPPVQGIRELTGGWVNRPVLAGAGGMFGSVIGGAAGVAAGPGSPVAVPAGILEGGALGTAGGSLLFDNIDSAAKWFQGENWPTINAAWQSIKRAAKEGTMDLAFSGGTMIVGGALRQPIKRAASWLLGVNTAAARRMTELARQQGIDLGLAHVSPRKIVPTAIRTLGVFPFVSTPIREGQTRIVGQLDERSADILNTLAPTSTTQLTSKTLTQKAIGRYRAATRIASSLYDRFNTIADNLSQPDVIPTDPIKRTISDMDETASKEAITLTTGEPLVTPGKDAIGGFIDQLKALPDRLTVRQVRGLERDLNGLIREYSRTGEGGDMSRLFALKHALEDSKAAIDVSKLGPEEATAVMGAWRKANKFFSDMRTLFESPTAQKFGRVDKTMFTHGVFRPGTKEADEIFRDVYSTRSIEALQDLRSLVGQRSFQKASRKLIEGAIEKSMIPAKEGQVVDRLFSAAKFEKQLGLDTAEGQAMMEEMLKDSPVSMADWRRFVEVAKTATDIEIRDPSTFIRRRLILGGSIVGAMAIGASKLSIPIAGLLTFATRKGARWLMSPKSLQTLTNIMDDTVPDHVRRAALVRLIRQSETSPQP